jgi:hypothetical protein
MRVQQCQDLAARIRQRDWVLELTSDQKKLEALILQGWSLSGHFHSLCLRFALDDFEPAESPDFILTGKNNRVAVEVTRIVSPKKAIYDAAGHFPEGGYTSTLRRSKPTREFHRAIETGESPDSSTIFPHVEPCAALESDYFSLATERLEGKAKSVSRYAEQYDHVVILLGDEMSELRPKIEQRLPQLVAIRNSTKFPADSEVVLVSCETESSSMVREIPKQD